MVSTTTTRALPAARHDDDVLLDLVAAVAREAERRGEAQAAAHVSQRVFNRLRADVDRARTVDPAGPDRTPTANAIVLHFRARAIRPLTWADVVAAALARPRQREQWLVATRRSEQAHWLTDSHIAFALRRLAADTVSPRAYETVSQRLIKGDRAPNGDDAVLAELLPTTDQVRHYCGDWPKALALAGLQPHDDPDARPERKHQASSTQPPGMPVDVALAYYAAINGVWASYPTLVASLARAPSP